MAKTLDYATGVFLGDCVELSVQGCITRKRLIEAFWQSAPVLLKEFMRAGIDPYGEDFLTAFVDEQLPGLIRTLATVGLRIVD